MRLWTLYIALPFYVAGFVLLGYCFEREYLSSALLLWHLRSASLASGTFSSSRYSACCLGTSTAGPKSAGYYGSALPFLLIFSWTASSIPLADAALSLHTVKLHFAGTAIGWVIAEMAILMTTVCIYAYLNNVEPYLQGEVSSLINMFRVLGG